MLVGRSFLGGGGVILRREIGRHSPLPRANDESTTCQSATKRIDRNTETAKPTRRVSCSRQAVAVREMRKEVQVRTLLKARLPRRRLQPKDGDRSSDGQRQLENTRTISFASVNSAPRLGVSSKESSSESDEEPSFVTFNIQPLLMRKQKRRS